MTPKEAGPGSSGDQSLTCSNSWRCWCGKVFLFILNSSNGVFGYGEQRKLYEVVWREDNRLTATEDSLFIFGCQKEKGVKRLNPRYRNLR